MDTKARSEACHDDAQLATIARINQHGGVVHVPTLLCIADRTALTGAVPSRDLLFAVELLLELATRLGFD